MALVGWPDMVDTLNWLKLHFPTSFSELSKVLAGWLKKLQRSC